MEFHAAATLFPMMENTAIKELAEDIAKNGQIEPILTVNGKIIDGRNRFEGCKLAGVEPVFEEYLGDTSDEGLLKLSLSLNMKRRHLDASQKAMLAVSYLDGIPNTRTALCRGATEAINFVKKEWRM